MTETNSNEAWNEFRRHNAEVVAEKAKGEGRAAAAYRLEQKMGLDAFESWASEEMQRGTPPMDLLTALGAIVGMHVLSVAMVTGNPAIAVAVTLGIAHDFADKVLSGEVKSEGMEFDPKTGKARHITATGIMKERAEQGRSDARG